MDFLLGLLIGWATVTVCVFLFGFVTYVDARGPAPKREGARMMFGSPLWPAAATVLAVRNFREAWQATGWGKR